MKAEMRITTQKVAKSCIFLAEKGKNIQICKESDCPEQVVNKFMHIIHKNREDFPYSLIEGIVAMC